MSILGHLYMSNATNLMDFTNPIKMLQNFPFIILLTVVNIFILIKIPAMTASIFSGSSGGHDAGMGAITGAITAGIMS